MDPTSGQSSITVVFLWLERAVEDPPCRKDLHELFWICPKTAIHSACPSLHWEMNVTVAVNESSVLRQAVHWQVIRKHILLYLVFYAATMQRDRFRSNQLRCLINLGCDGGLFLILEHQTDICRPFLKLPAFKRPLWKAQAAALHDHRRTNDDLSEPKRFASGRDGQILWHFLWIL